MAVDGFEVATYFGVRANPTVEFIRKDADLCDSFKPDVIIALVVLGGSL